MEEKEGRGRGAGMVSNGEPKSGKLSLSA